MFGRLPSLSLTRAKQNNHEHHTVCNEYHMPLLQNTKMRDSQLIVRAGPSNIVTARNLVSEIC